MLLLSIVTLSLSGCSEEECPYTEEILFHEAFDTFGNWESQPNQFGFHADSCIRVENGILKLKYQNGISGCGGTWIGLSIKDTASYRPEFLDKIGVRFSLDSGSFYQVNRWHDTIGVYGQPTETGDFPVRSIMTFRYNRIAASFPSFESSRVHRDSVFEVYHNRIEGSRFELIYDEGEFTLFIDEVEYLEENISVSDYWGEPVYLSIDFNLGHLPELNPRIEGIQISDFEIYTWCGTKNY